jgi:hypothetical protein
MFAYDALSASHALEMVDAEKWEAYSRHCPMSGERYAHGSSRPMGESVACNYLICTTRGRGIHAVPTP